MFSQSLSLNPHNMRYTDICIVSILLFMSYFLTVGCSMGGLVGQNLKIAGVVKTHRI
jgi:hypothetical protein